MSNNCYMFSYMLVDPKIILYGIKRKGTIPIPSFRNFIWNQEEGNNTYT